MPSEYWTNAAPQARFPQPNIGPYHNHPTGTGATTIFEEPRMTRIKRISPVWHSCNSSDSWLSFRPCFLGSIVPGDQTVDHLSTCEDTQPTRYDMAELTEFGTQRLRVC